MFCNTEGMFARGYCYDGARAAPSPSHRPAVYARERIRIEGRTAVT